MVKINTEIAKLTYNGAYKIYGKILTTDVKERLDTELNLIIENNFENYYLIAQKLAKEANENGYIVGTRGAVASSLVSYCLGITEIDPIKYNIPFETFAGINGNKKPDIVLTFSKEYEIKAQENLKIILNNLESKNSLKINIMVQDELSTLKKLEDVTGISHNNINVTDDKILNLFRKNLDTKGLFEFNTTFAEELIKKVKPLNVNELIKISAILHGTGLWKNNIEKLIEQHNLNEIACTRDDIYLHLLQKGINRETAFNIMEFVAKGKIQLSKYKEEWNSYINIMNEYNIPKWYITSLEKNKYMFPKAHCCNSIILNLYLAWYKVYYPKEFIEITSRSKT